MGKADQSKRVVLYADDDPDDIDFVREAFSRHAKDIELKTFSSAIELLQFIPEQDQEDSLPCLIILDINMPQMNGKDAVKQLRDMDRYGDVPIVLFSTSTSPHDIYFAKYFKAGFLTKPLSERQMDIIVEKFLDHCNEGVKE